MPVDRKIYKSAFYKGHPPKWQCPICNVGFLKGEKGSFHRDETYKSARKENPDLQSEDIKFTYHRRFICTNPVCKEVIFNIGTGAIDKEPTFDQFNNFDKMEYIEYFVPEFFIPHLNIFKIESNTPKDIKESINESFKLFFTSHSSALNHLRIATEKILNNLKVKKSTINKKRKKRISLNLHQRIELIPKKYSNLKELLLAIKWSGNTGSHNGHNHITIDNVMDAYDIFEIILNGIFSKNTDHIKKIAMKINKNKGIKK